MIQWLSGAVDWAPVIVGLLSGVGAAGIMAGFDSVRGRSHDREEQRQVAEITSRLNRLRRDAAGRPDDAVDLLAEEVFRTESDLNGSIDIPASRKEIFALSLVLGIGVLLGLGGLIYSLATLASPGLVVILGTGSVAIAAVAATGLFSTYQKRVATLTDASAVAYELQEIGRMAVDDSKETPEAARQMTMLLERGRRLRMAVDGSHDYKHAQRLDESILHVLSLDDESIGQRLEARNSGQQLEPGQSTAPKDVRG